MTRPPTVLMAHPGAELFGSDRMLIESVAAMVAADNRVVVALPAEGPLVAELRTRGAEVVLVRSLVLRKELLHPRAWGRLVRDTVLALLAMWRLLAQVAPDCVYVSTVTLPLWPLLSRVRGVRTVSHVHEAEGSARRLVNRALYTPHLAADIVLVNSEFSLETIRRNLPSLSSRCVIVRNGVAAPPTAPAPRGDLSGALRVTYVGRLSPRKGPDVALDAVTMLGVDGSHIDLTLVGSTFPGYEWFERELREKASQAPGCVHVAFAGFQPNVWDLLEHTDVVVVPSRVDEPFGNTAVEGVLARRVVIASDTSGLREAAGGYTTTRLVRPDDPEALASALREAMRSWPSLCAELEADRVVAAKKHSPDAYRRAVRHAITGTA